MEIDSAEIFRTIAQEVTGGTDTLAPVAKKSLSEAEADGRQRRTLRLAICAVVVLLLGAELWALYRIVIWQGLEILKLNEWAFTMLTNGVLLQTFFSFRTIVTHLFPDGAKEFSGKG